MTTNLQFTINNVSEANLVYQGQTITSGSGYTPSSFQQATFASDPGLVADTLGGKVAISIGSNSWSGIIGVEILKSAASLGASATSQLLNSDVISVTGQNRAQSITTTAAEALGGSTILVNRKFLSITPTNGTVYWGFSNAVTTTTGTPIAKNQTTTFSFTDNIHVYLIAAATTDCRISEGS